MKREMKLTAIKPDGSEVTITRSFDNERAAGNFAICRVRVNGQRFNRISCERELMILPNHPSETYRDLHAAILAVGEKG